MSIPDSDVRPWCANGAIRFGSGLESKIYTIEAKDYDDAVRTALTCPHVVFGAHLDVRRIDEF